MPLLTPKNPHQAARQYVAALRTGCTLGAIDLSFLRELATLSPELRHQRGAYFGIIERDGSPAAVRLPQLRKQVPVLLVTGTRTKTVLEKVTFAGPSIGSGMRCARFTRAIDFRFATVLLSCLPLLIQ